MKLILSTHNVTLTKTLEDRVEKRLEQLDHLNGRAVDARVTLEHDHRRMPEKQFSCSMQLALRGPDLFAEARESDLYAAIDVGKKNRTATSQAPQQNQGAPAQGGREVQTNQTRSGDLMPSAEPDFDGKEANTHGQ